MCSAEIVDVTQRENNELVASFINSYKTAFLLGRTKSGVKTTNLARFSSWLSSSFVAEIIPNNLERSVERVVQVSCEEPQEAAGKS